MVPTYAGRMIASQDIRAAMQPTPDRIFLLCTSHSTLVGVGADGRLVHGVTPDRAAWLLAVVPGGSQYLLVDGLGRSEAAVVPLQAETVPRGHAMVSLRHPGTARYLSAQGNSDAVMLDRDQAEAWEYFRVLPASLPQERAMHDGVRLLAGRAGNLADTPTIIALASRDDRVSMALAAALIQFAARADLLQAVPALAWLNSYETIFPVLQDRLSDRQRRLETQVNRVLADDIARYGWRIGDHSYGLPKVVEPQLGMLTIGKYCAFNEFSIILGNHRMDAVSTYPFTGVAPFWPTAQATRGLSGHVGRDVAIGNDVWIGHRALVLPGTSIGDGAVIGAHAVARGTIPPYAIVAGNPGQVLRYRFGPDTIARLLAIAWWHWPDHEVDRCIPLILGADIEPFLAYAETRQPRPAG